MELTWEEFLQLATVVTTLRDSIWYFNLNPENDIIEEHRKVAAAAINYRELFNDLKYMKFMDELRLCFTKLKYPKIGDFRQN